MEPNHSCISKVSEIIATEILGFTSDSDFATVNHNHDSI